MSKRDLVFLNQSRRDDQKTDKRRASYYNYYTQLKWGDLKNFDLALNSKIGKEKVIDAIIRCYNS